MNEQNSIDILERIHASYYQLTAAERKVADYVLTQHSQVQFMSITQLADECGTAEATISRFCRSLKLKGFNAFKIELARHSVGSGQKSVGQPSDSILGRSQEVGRLAIDAVHQTVEMVEPKQVRKSIFTLLQVLLEQERCRADVHLQKQYDQLENLLIHGDYRRFRMMCTLW